MNKNEFRILFLICGFPVLFQVAGIFCSVVILFGHSTDFFSYNVCSTVFGSNGSMGPLKYYALIWGIAIGSLAYFSKPKVRSWIRNGGILVAAVIVLTAILVGY